MIHQSSLFSVLFFLYLICCSFCCSSTDAVNITTSVRFFQASPSQNNIGPGSLSIDGVNVISDIAFGTASSFVEIEGGNHTFSIANDTVTLSLDLDPTLDYLIVQSEDQQGNFLLFSYNFLNDFDRENSLTLDSALVRIINVAAFPKILRVSFVDTNCFNCLNTPIATLSQGEFNETSLSTQFPIQLTIDDSVAFDLDFTYQFGDRGLYTILITTNSFQSQDTIVFIYADVEPYDVDTPIVIAFCTLLGAALLYAGAKILFARWKKSREALGTDRGYEYERLIHSDAEYRNGNVNGNRRLSENSQPGTLNGSAVQVIPEVNICSSCGQDLSESDRFCGFCGTKRVRATGSGEEVVQRLRSLDTFRGIALTIMIFVNYGGGGYWYFAHATWNGLTVADLVFPWFIYMMGVSMALAFEKLRRKNIPRGGLAVKAFRRAATLFALGLFLYAYQVDLTRWRMFGVLQRFAISYLAVALLVLFVPVFPVQQSHFKDLSAHWLQWVVISGIIITHTCITFLLEVPGCGTGYLGAGGIGDQGMYVNCTGGAAGYIDSLVFGNHMYQTPTCKDMYHTGPYDPEGLLGCLTSIAITFFGYQTGRIITSYSSHKGRIIRWIIWGVLLGVIGVILSKGSQNDGWIPINKNLWSLSFILVMAGLGNLALALCYYLIDVTKFWNGAPFIYPGMNSIVIYMGSELFQQYFPFSYYQNVTNTHGGNLIMNIIGVSCWILIAYVLYLKKIFISV